MLFRSPTTRNRQGNDVGTSYRSAIFYTSDLSAMALGFAALFIAGLALTSAALFSVAVLLFGYGSAENPAFQDGAIADYTKAIELDDANPTYYDNRALSKTEKEDYAGAVEDYTSSIALYPSDPETYYQRALVKLSMNNMYDACLDFKTADDLGSAEAKAAIKKNCK